MNSRDYPEHLLHSFGELSRLLLVSETVGATLDVVARLAVQTIPACDVASISLVKGNRISTLGSSDEVAAEMDAIQYEIGQGPCLDAIGKEAMWFQLDAMSEDRQWPDFSARAAEKGFQSLLAFTLKVDAGTLGALNLYARAPTTFTEEDRETGAIYAAHAAVALANAQTHARDARIREELDEILLSQQTTGQAQGILMEREFHSAEEALRILQVRAEELSQRLRDSAGEVVQSADRHRTELKLPEGFTDRTVASADAERPGRGRQVSRPLVVLTALLAVALLIGFAAMAFQFVATRRDAQAQSDALRAVLSGVDGAIELGGAPGAVARVVPAQRGSMFVVVGLREAPDGHTYQLWLLRGDELVSSRPFDTDDDVALVELSEPTTSLGRAEVTVEPAGGSQEPTTEPILESR